MEAIFSLKQMRDALLIYTDISFAFIGGVFASTVLILFVLPALYRMVASGEVEKP